MPSYKNFEQFARDLYLYSTDIIFDPRRTVDRAPTAFMRRAASTLVHFADGHHKKISRAVTRNLPQQMTTDEEFMRFVIPKCLNLIDDERYFYSLMLVAAFIEEVQSILNEKYRCYRFGLSGYKCLTAVFKRKFEGKFEANGGFKGLDNYFKSVFKSIDKRKNNYRLMTLLNGRDRNLVLRVVDLMKNCCTALDQEFLLNDYELSVAEDVEASKKDWFDATAAAVKDDSPIKFDVTIDLAMNKTQTSLQYVYDKDEDVVKPVVEVPDLKLSDLMAKTQFPDSDVDTSDSESESEPETDNFFDSMGFQFFNVMKPDDFDRVMSARECKFCKTYCYQFGIYKFYEYCGLAEKVRLPGWYKAARDVVLEKIPGFLRGLLSWRN